ncbi:MAG TPA: AMP-binding protein [Candidatus Nanopelagicaceae bacterium]|nr:AMP-binding protein [Candidatus Nanopelagicaceae bacterium]
MPLDGVVPFPAEFQARYRARGYWQDQTMDEVFRAAFARHAERPAVIFGERTISYGELQRSADQLAGRLWQEGLRPLDRVVVHLPNCPEFLQLHFALQRLGVVPIMALAAHRRYEIDHYVRLAGASAYFGPTRALGEEVQAENECLRLVMGLEELGDQRPAPTPPPFRADPDDPCVLLLSGGTTGIPKLIPRTHNDYVYNTQAANLAQDISANTVQLCVLPLAHNMPLACPGVQGVFLEGGKVVLGASTRATDVLPAIAQHAVTHVAAVPALYIRWLADPLAESCDLRSVQLLQSGGQRLQPEVRRRMARTFPNAFVQENFGMSEGTLFFTHRDDPEEVRLETVGIPVCADDEVRLTDEEGRDVPDGEVGELTVRGPYTLRGYYRAEDYNRRVFTPDGFYRSGDLMRRHPSGSYLVEGRIKDLVNRGGEKISAEEVENLILTHPSVRNVACVPLSDPILGERMCACVILREGSQLELDELTGHLMALGVAKFKLPERLEIVESFPLSAFGKVSKKALAKRFEAATVAS